MKRGEIWIATLGPVIGSEQAGTRPVLIVQPDFMDDFLRTTIVVPCTTNLKWSRFSFCTPLAVGEGGLSRASVALGHQVKALDKIRLKFRLGQVTPDALTRVEKSLAVAQELF